MDLDKLTENIAYADDETLTQLIEALLKRQKILHPDWEGMYLSFPLQRPDECKVILEGVWRILNKDHGERALRSDLRRYVCEARRDVHTKTITLAISIQKYSFHIINEK